MTHLPALAKKILPLLALFTGFFPTISTAELPPFLPVDEISARFLTADNTVTAGGETTLAIEFAMPEGWHVYWKNPGDSGLPPTLTVSDAEAVATSGEITYPAPIPFPTPPIMNYAYKDSTLFRVPLTISSTAPTNTPLTFTANATFLMCKDICIPGRLSTPLTLQVGSAAVENPGVTALIAQHPTPTVWQGTFSAKSTKTGYSLTLEGAKGTYHFMPIRDGMIEDLAPQKITHKNGQTTLRLKKDDWADTLPTHLEGLIITPTGTFVVPATPILVAKTSPILPPAFIIALLFAFLGGVILNLMPCVLPVLALKIIAFTRPQAKPHATAYTLGILGGFWGLAATTLALKHIGLSVGWGFQLQNPFFVGFIALLMVVMALNLWSLFYLPMPRFLANHRHGESASHAAATGLLAVLLATPCTVPFMGVAVAFALTQSAFYTFAIFTAMGLGLAAPYIALAAIPASRKWCPKPGAWMDILKHALAFPLLATALWLVWVYGQLTSLHTATALLALMLMASLILWIVGLMQKTASPQRWPWGVVVLLLGVSLWMFLPKPPTQNIWKPWNDIALENTINQGQSAFLNVTADWCITCKVTEELVLNTQKTADLFKEFNVTPYMADWTKYDPKITTLLEEYGRKGVPLYVVFTPYQPPKILGQLPSVSDIRRALVKGTTP